MSAPLGERGRLARAGEPPALPASRRFHVVPALPLVVAVAGDPGGAMAVASVIEALRAEGRVAVQALAYRQACTVWGKRSLSFALLPESTTGGEALNALRDSGTRLLLTGTSFNAIDLEKSFIAAARECSVPSLSVLDFWSNYRPRFGDGTGRLSFVPDRIAVMDRQARDEMVAEGFDPSRLEITGQPALDDLAAWRSGFTLKRREALRSGLSVQPEELLVLFASQPLSALFGKDAGSPLFPGYTERTVLRSLVAALDRIAERHGRGIVLAIRPHPREQAGDFGGVGGRAIRTVVAAEGESRDLAMAADLVTGMNSVLLLEACSLGCLTVSLQPGLRLPDALPTNRSGLSRAVYRQEEIDAALQEMLLDEESRSAASARLSELRLDEGATRRVVELIHQMIGVVKQ